MAKPGNQNKGNSEKKQPSNKEEAKPATAEGQAAAPVIPPPPDRDKLEIEKLQEEVAELKAVRNPWSFVWPVKISDFVAPVGTIGAALVAAYIAVQSGILDARSERIAMATERSRNENILLTYQNEKLAERQKEYERNLAKLAVDNAVAVKEKREIEDVLRPLRGEIEAGEKLSALSSVGIWVQLSRDFGFDEATSAVLRSHNGISVDKDLKEEDVVSALKAVGDLPAVHSLTFAAIHVTDALLRHLPKTISDITFESCELDCDLSVLNERPRLSSVSISRGNHNFTVSGPIHGVRHLSVANLQSMEGVPQRIAKAFPSAVYVEFEHVALTDADVKELKPMTGIGRISLFNTKVTEKCVDTLKTFPKLEAIGLLPEVAKQGWISGAKCHISNLRLTFAGGKQLGALSNEQSREEAN